ncbi:MAG: tetratricopeptide repeat protein [Bacteroidetes bacterium]|nr:tetratricopeptide repeat protein [Bacteroidota bacterium]
MRTFEEIAADIDRAMINNEADVLRTLAVEMQALNTPQAEAHANLAIGTAERQVGAFASALESLRRAHDLYEELGDSAGAARATGSIGNVYQNTGNNVLAIEQFRRALALHTELGDRISVARSMNNMGNVFYNTGDYPSALEHYRAALSTYEEIGDVVATARITANIGSIYGITGDYPSALEHLQRTLAVLDERSDKFTTALVTVNIGGVYKVTGNDTLALEHFHRALSLTEELGDRAHAALCYANMGNVYSEIREFTKALDYYSRALAIGKELGDSALIANMTGASCGVYIELGRYEEAAACLDALSTMPLASPLIQSGYKANCSELARHRGDLDGARMYALEAMEIASSAGLRAEAARCHALLRDLAQLRNDFAAYIEHNTKYTRITEEINGKETATKLAMQAKQREIDAREREHAKHLAVLHSTLPKEVAERVARGETVNDHYENAAVIFADIVGFTQISENLSPGDVVALLERIFTAFDAICEKYGVTKIKTIGDSYMAVAFDGIVNAALCALEMSRIRFSHEVSHNVSHSVSHSVSHEVSHAVSHNVSHEVSHSVSHSVSHPVSHEVAFRIGMHSGPVTAGVIGTQRLQYDVWGDTVNVASRMESSGEPGKVHVSEAFALQLKANTEYTIQNSIAESSNPESHSVSHAVSHEVSHNVSHAVSHEVSHEVSHSVSHEVPLVTRHSSLVTQLRGSFDIKGKGLMNTYWLEGRA